MPPFCVVLLNIIVFISVIQLSLQLSCKDESNRNVDWFVNYKLPKLEKGYDGTDISLGKAYTYITSSNPGNWKLSTRSITTGASMLAKTLKPFMTKRQQSTFLFYNDEPPDGYNGTANGHLKGIVAFDGKEGFWIIHSIPKFSAIDRYNYPSNAFENGQSILCVTFKTSTIKEICRQLLYCNPKIYESGITSEVSGLLDEDTRSLFTSKPKFVRTPPFTRAVPLKSKGQEIFLSFAKDGQFKNDVYKSVIAPGLKASLATETWRRGSGTYLPASCESEYIVLDISDIKMAAEGRNGVTDISFKSTEDHSKWAVALNSTQNWICVGDMNRMASQERRGGGALCFQSKPVGKAYRDLISNSDQCPI